MGPFLYLIAFGAAIWAIGEGWSALIHVWAVPTWRGGAALAWYLAVFLVAFLYLGFGIYAAERSAGKVRTRIALYERILARHNRTGNGEQGRWTETR